MTLPPRKGVLGIITILSLASLCSSFVSPALPRFPLGKSRYGSEKLQWRRDRHLVENCSIEEPNTDHDQYGKKLPAGNQIQERRAMVGSIFSAATIAVASSKASAYEKTFPVDLDFENGDTSRDLSAIRTAKINREKEQNKQSMEFISSSNPLFFRGPKDVLSSVLWGGALWFLSGSRSNPLVTPLANLFYDEREEDWLKDRNDNLFGSIPTQLLLVLSVVFFFLGIAVDRTVLLATQGDSNVCLQLAGVSLISGGALELGRIASGEKKQTREDFDRASQLEEEFAEFASKRLIAGGNCHRSEVVKAFRRYFAKYRQADNAEYPLSDLEIERLVRNWNRDVGNAPMSSAGFLTGIQINDQADVFVSR